MKLIDQTPYFNENGEISFMDRAKATMKFGAGWFKELEAQKSIMATFEKILDKNYTLLRNVVPPGLEARFPFILVGPTGVFVMATTPLLGMFRAKGDQWGTVVGSTYKPENPNLLVRTEKMARAIQVFLQRQGYNDLTSVEAVLLCADPAVTVDSLRPIIRVVMRDALERFAVSIAQTRIVLTPEDVHHIVKRILNPQSPAAVKAAEEAPAEQPAPAEEEADQDPYVPAFAMPGSENIQSGSLLQPEQEIVPEEALPASPHARRRPGVSRKQMLLLIIMFIFWCLIIAVFAYLVTRDLFL